MDATYGLTPTRYAQAYRAGRTAYRTEATRAEVDIDRQLDRYMAKHGLSSVTEPVAMAWQDGWTHGGDYSPTAYIAVRTEELAAEPVIILSGDYYLTNADGSHNPIGSAPIEMAAEPVITLSWEDGVRIEQGIACSSKADAFKRLDGILSRAEWPSSIHIVIYQDGIPVWAQNGTDVYLNV